MQPKNYSEARQIETPSRVYRPKDPSLDHRVEMVEVADLRPARRNARQHSKKQIGQIADAIGRFRYMNPLVVDEHGKVIAGHGRLAAAKLLGMTRVPVIRLAHLSDVEVRALMLADNRIAESAGWDRELLAVEFGELAVALPKIGLDLSITGFEPGQIDSILTDFGPDRPDPADEIPDAAGLPAVARTGDMFVLGRHRLVVGDARDERAFEQLMQGEIAAMAFGDPPYNLEVKTLGGRGRIKHREFKAASGEMTREQFVTFLEDTLGLCARYSADGSIHFVCMDWRHAGELIEAGDEVFTELKNVCVWVKNNGGQGAFYRSQHELVFVFKNGTAPHTNTFGLGQGGRSRTNVWHYAGVNTFRSGRMDELKMHPTVKPVALVVDAMKDVSKRGAIVLDAFAGSGTTIIAAEQVGRRAYCMEIDPLYADVCVRRWQKYTGRDAVLAITGETFDDLQNARTRPAAVGDRAALPSVTSPNLAGAAAAPKRSSRRASKSSTRNTKRRARRS